MNELVSVIIPTYNRVDYLKIALKSVLEQTNKNIEVIVVDDGSTDKTSDVVMSFNDTRVKYFCQEHSGFPAVGRNLGMQKAIGKYIAFLDDDDMWFHKKLEKQVEYLHKHPEYFLVYSNGWIIDEEGVQGELLLKPKFIREGDIFLELTKRNFILQSSVLMKKEVFNNIGFFTENPSIRAAEDYEYWLRVALQYKIGFVKEPLVMYRIHSGGIINNVNSAKIDQIVLSSLLNNSIVLNKNKVKKSINKLYLRSAYFCWQNSDKKAAINELKNYFVMLVCKNG